MRIFEVEVVVGSIEIGGHHSDEVGAVLEIVGLAHLESGYLGDGILLVGVLQGRREQAVLAHGLGCLLGVDAGGAEEEQFLHTMGVGVFYHVALHLHVLHDEVGAVERVGHDAAHKGCGEDHGVGAFLVEEGLDSLLVGEVELAVGAAHQIVVAARLEIVPDGRAHESAVPGDVYLGVLRECHRCVILRFPFPDIRRGSCAPWRRLPQRRPWPCRGLP